MKISMIKELKIKFILTNMFLVGIVMTAVFFAVCVLTYFREEVKISEQLSQNAETFENHVPSNPSLPGEPDSLVYNAEFVVLTDRNGNILFETENSLNDETLNQYINIVLKTAYERGNLKGAELSFLKQKTKDGFLIAFLSREHLIERVTEAIYHSSVAAIVSFLLFLFMSSRLAKMAIAPVEKAWEQQKQFLADASHDLKTPLTVILANSNIISSHKDETVASQMKWIESTSEEAVRMSDLVNKMLELAKSEAAREELRLGEANISELVENAILQFEVVAFEKGIAIESDIVPYIIGITHRATFSKILEILFDNAIKYSDRNGKITVTLSQTSKRIIFTITNYGEHIDEKDLPYIFERFYRSNKERKVGGHGLGLSLAKKKCDMIAAKLSVMSDEINGTTFTISIKSHRKTKIK